MRLIPGLGPLLIPTAIPVNRADKVRAAGAPVAAAIPAAEKWAGSVFDSVTTKCVQ